MGRPGLKNLDDDDDPVSKMKVDTEKTRPGHTAYTVNVNFAYNKGM